LVLAHLFVKLLRPGGTVKGPFWSSSQAATCYYQSNHLKVEVIPFKYHAQGTTSELDSIVFTLSL